MPQSMFYRIFPDRRDPNNPRRYLCRYCGKPSVSPKKYYCSDECNSNCQRAISWWFARQGVFKRDEGKCVKCGKNLDFNATWDCHHVIPVKDLWNIAWDSVFENNEWALVSDNDKARGYAIIYTLLVHDINNLVTLCSKCHKLEHAAKPETMVYEESLGLEYFFKKGVV